MVNIPEIQEAALPRDRWTNERDSYAVATYKESWRDSRPFTSRFSQEIALVVMEDDKETVGLWRPPLF